MKRHLLYFLLFAMVLGSCKKFKTEPLMENPDDRLSANLSLYQTQLTGAEFGWKAYLLTASGGNTAIEVAAFLFSFKDNKVTMSADYVKNEKEQKKESSYRLKALQRPTLIFDTYSILHKITDPTPEVFNGTTGDGHYADFEYAFLSASADTIKLEGTFYKNKLYLIRSKSAADNATAFSAKNNMSKIFSSLRTYFKPATINGIVYQISFDPKKSVVSFAYTDSDGEKKSISSKCFVPDTTSLVFFDPITIGNKTLIHIKDIIYDASSNIIKATTSYGETFQIKEITTPLNYDATTAAKFIGDPRYRGHFDSRYKWSESSMGFTVDGVVDAYGIRKIRYFYGLVYYHQLPEPEYQRIILSTYFENYGINIKTTVSDGKIFFKPYAGGRSDDIDIPPEEIKPVIDNTMNSFLTEEGFYVFQTGERSYDLVSAKDARKWISFP